MYKKIKHLEKFEHDVKKWCHVKNVKLKELCKLVGYNEKYITVLFTGDRYPEAPFWPKLKKVTGLKRESYCE